MSKRFPGTYYRKDTDSWWISYSDNGKRFREEGGKTQAIAWESLKARRREVQTGRHLGHDLEKVTVKDIVADLLSHLEARNIKSIKTFRSHGKRVTKELGHLRCVQVTGSTLDGYVRARAAKKKKPTTINRELEVLRQAFNRAKDNRRVYDVPKFHKLDEAGSIRQGFLSADEVVELVKQLPDPYDDAVDWAFETGWRKGEIVGLTWDQVDRRAHEVRLTETKERAGRYLVLEGHLAEIVEKRWRLRKYKTRGRRGLSRYVFHRGGRRIGDFRKAWATACKAAGITGRRFHDLRRSAVREMNNAGIPQAVAMTFTGHKTSAVYRRYSITTPDDQRRAIILRAAARSSSTASRGVLASMAKRKEGAAPAANGHGSVTQPRKQGVSRVR